MKHPITILIADDHPVFRSGLKHIINSEVGLNVIADVNNGDEALTFLERNLPDITILDIDMPVLNGLDAARVIMNKNIETEIIFLTMYKEEDVFNKAMDIGAQGYVLKESAVKDILAAIHTVAGGKHYISPSISEYLVNRAGYSSDRHKNISDLTTAERRVLILIAEHKTNNEIAEELSISPKTVARHRENVSNKLNLHGKYALLKFVLDNKDKL